MVVVTPHAWRQEGKTALNWAFRGRDRDEVVQLLLDRRRLGLGAVTMLLHVMDDRPAALAALHWLAEKGEEGPLHAVLAQRPDLVDLAMANNNTCDTCFGCYGAR